MLKQKQNETERLPAKLKIKRSFEARASSKWSSALEFFESSLVCKSLHLPNDSGLLMFFALGFGLGGCSLQDIQVLTMSIRVFNLI